MRPVRRGPSPQNTDFTNYQDAKPFLVSRLGAYCSYCERHIQANLAVEHIQPKRLPAYAGLIGRWDNFLLGCVNCNSAKGNKDVDPALVLLPDRDNTAAAFEYTADGRIDVVASTTSSAREPASALLALVGLDKPITIHVDENGKQVALDRIAQRMEVWAIAQEALSDVTVSLGAETVRRQVVRSAQANGFFSIWMTVFAADVDMRNRFIDAFAGTRDSGCFTPQTAHLVTPAPNPDQLAGGGKL